MTEPSRGAAVARPAKFYRAEPGPPGAVVLALRTEGGMEPFIMASEDAMNAAAALLLAVASDPDDPLAYPVSGLGLAAAEDATVVLRLKLGGGFLPLSLEPALVEELKALLERTPDAPQAPPSDPRH